MSGRDDGVLCMGVKAVTYREGESDWGEGRGEKEE